jgi:hypothetical protein
LKTKLRKISSRRSRVYHREKGKPHHIKGVTNRPIRKASPA